MNLRQFGFIAALLTAASIAGSGGRTQGPVDAPRPGGANEVVDLNGLRDVAFGDTEEDLDRRGLLQAGVAACGQTLAGHAAASPIFIDDRLVLLWVEDPFRTPEGIAVGTTVDEVRASYRTLHRLTAPTGTYRLDGLLARRGDRAYLFLHDGRTVRKIIAGYAEWARRLFDAGHGPC